MDKLSSTFHRWEASGHDQHRVGEHVKPVDSESCFAQRDGRRSHISLCATKLRDNQTQHNAFGPSRGGAHSERDSSKRKGVRGVKKCVLIEDFCQ